MFRKETRDSCLYGFLILSRQDATPSTKISPEHLTRLCNKPIWFVGLFLFNIRDCFRASSLAASIRRVFYSMAAICPPNSTTSSPTQFASPQQVVQHRTNCECIQGSLRTVVISYAAFTVAIYTHSLTRISGQMLNVISCFLYAGLL